MTNRRYAHIEMLPAPGGDSILRPIGDRYRWNCDYCRFMRARIGVHGKWTSEDGANDEADRHDAFHESQRQLDVKVAAYRQTRP
jgi:hypothetical protein